jgi:hypothetical protein
VPSHATYDGIATLLPIAGTGTTQESRMNSEHEGRHVEMQPADADWIPRLLRELSFQYSEVGVKGDSVRDGLQPFAMWMRALSDPGGVVAAQQAMLSLACTHFWAMQNDWADAWWRFMTGEMLKNGAPQGLVHAGFMPWIDHPQGVQGGIE